jgi:hypothetical protein
MSKEKYFHFEDIDYLFVLMTTCFYLKQSNVFINRFTNEFTS